MKKTSTLNHANPEAAKIYARARGLTRDCIEQILSGANRVRPAYSDKMCYHDYTDNVTYYLHTAGIDYKTGNDAPRGGASGKYIDIIR